MLLVAIKSAHVLKSYSQGSYFVTRFIYRQSLCWNSRRSFTW